MECHLLKANQDFPAVPGTHEEETSLDQTLVSCWPRCEFLWGLVWDQAHPDCWWYSGGMKEMGQESEEVCRLHRLCSCFRCAESADCFLEAVWSCGCCPSFQRFVFVTDQSGV